MAACVLLLGCIEVSGRAMLCALSLEPLLQKIRSDVHGLVLPGFNDNVKLSAYADDAVILM